VNPTATLRREPRRGLRVPYDDELERTVLAERLRPLHCVAGIADLEPGQFYVPQHSRILANTLDGTTLTHDDAAYVDEIDRDAWPLCAGNVERFVDLARRRARLAELEHERLSLLGAS
jgi:hypothetical protein